MKPTIGRIVIYNTTDEDRKRMELCNQNIQRQLPAIIVAVWGETETSCINVKVIIDGPGELWKTSINKGDAPGNWNWPQINAGSK